MIDEKMPKTIKVIQIILYTIFIISIIIFFIVAIFIYIDGISIEPPCKTFEDTCEYYKCMSDEVPTYMASNNYLLKYQVCLMEKKE